LLTDALSVSGATDIYPTEAKRAELTIGVRGR
jgi:hypothetical protein